MQLNIWTGLAVAVASFILYQALGFIKFLIRPWFSPLKILKGPPGGGLIRGHLELIRKADYSDQHEAWAKKYGHVLKYKGFFNGDRLCTTDLKALNHILTHSYDYEKPAMARRNLARLLGDGILVTEGDKHRQQRRVMNPSFSPNGVRNLAPIFFKKAQLLRDLWKADIKKAGEPSKQIEILTWLSRTTLDIIGIAGFNYKFDALSHTDPPNELNQAFSALFHVDRGFQLLPFLQAFIPTLQMIPTKRGMKQNQARGVMRRIGLQLINQRRREILGQDNDELASPSRKGSIDEDTDDYLAAKGKDLLSALMRANMDDEIPENQRIDDEDVLAQVPTFLVAGHETTSTETMWCLYALAQRPHIQSKLREELLAVATDSPSMDDLMALPYLDNVVRETLRVHAAVHSTVRLATKDDLIPVAEPYTDKYGNEHTSIRVAKGDTIFIPIILLHRMESIWGPDAKEFNPDRWNNLPETVKQMPGVWGNLLTFLGGARSCIGYRFALVEMKALLFTLLRAFEFEMVHPREEFEVRSGVVSRPYLKSDSDGRSQMPLKVTPVVKA